MHPILDAADWYEALALAERAGGASRPGDGDPERAARREQRWRTETGLLDEGLLAERLASEGLTREVFRSLLGETSEDLRRRLPPPPWLACLSEAYSRHPAATGSPGLLEPLRPLLDSGYARLRAGLDSRFLDPDSVSAGLMAHLAERLRWMAERTLVLELHIARIEGRLSGETPEERFASFAGSLRGEGGLDLLIRYPLLAREACRHVDQWAESSLEILSRLAEDRERIVQELAQGDPGRLVEVQAGLSDRHAGGRGVAILTFASGFKAVYKPKSLAVDLHFQELLAWLNERGAEPVFQPVRVLDRGPYGWMEHLSPAPCGSPAGVERFFERQGAYVALLYALEGNDFHHENLIACGENPVLLDLETLFQPLLPLPTPSGLIWDPLAGTVLRSGLLPRRVRESRHFNAVDLSGLGAAGGTTAGRAPVDSGTDRMRFAPARFQVLAGDHRPTLDGEPADLWPHRDAVLRGFRSTYRLLARLRGELLAPDGPLAGFAEAETRVLVRGTSAYVHLTHHAYHPDFLRSGLDRSRLWDRLWAEADRKPLLRRIVPAEITDLARGDVPRFVTRPASVDVFAGAGRRIEGLIQEPGLELVRRTIAGLGEEDLERQTWIVRAALESVRPLEERASWPREPLPEAEGPADPGRFQAAARKLGDRLATLAVTQGERLGWFHMDLDEESWSLAPAGVDLYSGLTGISLFLAHLGALSGEERYTDLARRALATARRRMAVPRILDKTGAFSGKGGALYALTHLGLLWSEPALLDEAEALAAALPGTLDGDEDLDLIGGAAGGAAALLTLHRHRPSRSTLEAATQCGEHLLSRARTGERGTCWPPPPGGGEVPLTGFGHGAAGMAWALAWLGQITGEERFREAARGALRYERSWFSKERGNWPDLRADRAGSWFHAWCHGAPGIGLGRLAALPFLEDAETAGEIQAAVRSTEEEGFGQSHCLCHGDLGNLELLRKAGEKEKADLLAARILARIERDGPRCGASLATEIPGLMTGLAGIGYGLLRAAAPDRVPSVLLLETPAV